MNTWETIHTIVEELKLIIGKLAGRVVELIEVNFGKWEKANSK